MIFGTPSGKALATEAALIPGQTAMPPCRNPDSCVMAKPND